MFESGKRPRANIAIHMNIRVAFTFVIKDVQPALQPRAGVVSAYVDCPSHSSKETGHDSVEMTSKPGFIQ